MALDLQSRLRRPMWSNEHSCCKCINNQAKPTVLPLTFFFFPSNWEFLILSLLSSVPSTVSGIKKLGNIIYWKNKNRVMKSFLSLIPPTRQWWRAGEAGWGAEPTRLGLLCSNPSFDSGGGESIKNKFIISFKNTPGINEHIHKNNKIGRDETRRVTYWLWLSCSAFGS